MRYLCISLFLFISCFTSCKDATTPVTPEATVTTTYYLIRHAEKDRSDPENRNPSLTEEGIARANNWASTFEDVPFDAVYSTTYARTQQTAMPTATQKGLEIQSYDPRNLFDENFQNATLGKTVLVVGHSNTTPNFVNAIIKEDRFQDIDDSNNTNLYIVTLTGDKSSTQLLHID
ncbi:SixA phosphatase family protein [Dokdonia ponticola]|uniref:SixA phosphatase family protein n=1 Tax=Dokdonia ponticola TaxID=2041041 RepID=A0ABV9HX43_9FLAO